MEQFNIVRVENIKTMQLLKCEKFVGNTILLLLFSGSAHQKTWEDYININGLKIWQEEVTRIINFNVEQECNGFLRTKVHAWESVHQSRYVPIPHYPPTDNISENYIGRLAREIIRLTDPRSTVYLQQMSAWYDAKTHKPVFSKQTVGLISSAIEVTGLVGLDRLFSFMIITNLKKVAVFLENKETKSNAKYNILCNIIAEINAATTSTNVTKFYQNCINRTTKIWAEFVDHVLIIGQLQLLRNLFAFHLNLSCKFTAKILESSLSSVNKALIAALYDDNHETPLPSENLMFTLSRYFDYSGINNPYNAIYITANSNEEFAVILFVFVIAHVQRLYLPSGSGSAQKKLQEPVDGVSFVIALHTILKQFHESVNSLFIKLLVEYCCQLTKYYISLKYTELPLEAVLALKFLDLYTTFSKSSQDCFSQHMPEEIFHLHQTLASAST